MITFLLRLWFKNFVVSAIWSHKLDMKYSSNNLVIFGG